MCRDPPAPTIVLQPVTDEPDVTSHQLHGHPAFISTKRGAPTVTVRAHTRNGRHRVGRSRVRWKGPMMTTVEPITLVVLDATDPDGEAGLGFLTSHDCHVALLVLTSGSSAAALLDYAQAENLDIVTAGWTYLEQACDRARMPGRLVQAVLVDGPSVAREVIDFDAQHAVGRVLLPVSFERRDPHGVGVVRVRVAAPVAVVSTPVADLSDRLSQAG
jgi:hypothetical protein